MLRQDWIWRKSGGLRTNRASHPLSAPDFIFPVELSNYYISMGERGLLAVCPVEKSRHEYKTAQGRPG